MQGVGVARLLGGLAAGLGLRQAGGDLAEQGGGQRVGLIEEVPQVLDVALPLAHVKGLLGGEPLPVPGAAQQCFGGEQLPQCGIGDVFAFELAVAHDMQQGEEGWAGEGNAAVGEVVFGDQLLRGNDVIHAVGERRRVLGFGAEHLRAKDIVRVVEDNAEEGSHEVWRDPVPEAAGEDAPPVHLKIFHLFQIVLFDQRRRQPLGHLHP